MAHKFKSYIVKINIDIPPNYINQIDEYFYNYFSNFLFKYIEKFDGILIAYKLKGYLEVGQIAIGSSNILISFYCEIILIEFEKGLTYRVDRGFIYNLFSINGDENFSGLFVLKKIEQRGNRNAIFNGKKFEE